MSSGGILYKIMVKGRYDIRYNLDQCYRFNEYNKAISYATKYIDIKGIKELALNLKQTADKYEKDIAKIVNPRRENEERKYNQWKNWNRIKDICKWIAIGLISLAVFSYIINIFINIGNMALEYIFLLSVLFTIVTIPLFFVAKVGEFICRNIYNHFVKSIKEEIDNQNFLFAEESRNTYRAMDNLYLISLDASHREMVLMHREQIEHNKKMEHLEKERQRKEEERLREQKRARKVQERLLEIEEERERRRNSW